jgi:hypothetical protein
MNLFARIRFRLSLYLTARRLSRTIRREAERAGVIDLEAERRRRAG